MSLDRRKGLVHGVTSRVGNKVLASLADEHQAIGGGECGTPGIDIVEVVGAAECGGDAEIVKATGGSVSDGRV